jgi:hypothetical protein
LSKVHGREHHDNKVVGKVLQHDSFRKQNHLLKKLRKSSEYPLYLGNFHTHLSNN